MTQETYDLMKNETRNIIKDLKAGRDLPGSVKRYSELLSTAFTKYASFKLSMNYYTMLEMLDEADEERKKETEDIFNTIRNSLTAVVRDKKADEENITKLLEKRQLVTDKMKVLTSFTDAMSVFEYVLLRKDPETVLNAVDTAVVAENMYNYVFQDNDKLVINSKIQSFIAELPVRMTKERFFDIISNTLAIYRGGEKEAVNDFAEMIRTVSLIEKPEGFETCFPALYKIYEKLSAADMKELSKKDHLNLMADISAATEMISDHVTDYLMLEEVINDTLVLLLTDDKVQEELLDEKDKAAEKILIDTLALESIYEAPAGTDELFEKLEGAQEEAYDTLANISSSLFDISTEYSETIEEAGLKDCYDRLIKADKLTSTSLFIDLDKEIRIVNDAADDQYIDTIKSELEESFKALFAELPVYLRRSVMAKVLSVIPVFFNNKEEIRDYFLYALDKCSDKVELSATVAIINDLMLSE